MVLAVTVFSVPVSRLQNLQKDTLLQVDGDWRYDARKSIMLWSIDIIDASNRTGSLEFVVPSTRPEAFFPVTVNFNATRTLCQVYRHCCIFFACIWSCAYAVSSLAAYGHVLLCWDV